MTALAAREASPRGPDDDLHLTQVVATTAAAAATARISSIATGTTPLELLMVVAAWQLSTRTVPPLFEPCPAVGMYTMWWHNRLVDGLWLERDLWSDSSSLLNGQQHELLFKPCGCAQWHFQSTKHLLLFVSILTFKTNAATTTMTTALHALYKRLLREKRPLSPLQLLLLWLLQMVMVVLFLVACKNSAFGQQVRRVVRCRCHHAVMVAVMTTLLLLVPCRHRIL